MDRAIRDAKRSRTREFVPLSSVAGGYLLLLFAQVFASPYLIVNGLRRVFFGRHKGVGIKRFFGGVSPSTKGCVIIVGNAMGESRTALRAARDLRDRQQQNVGVWVEQVAVKRALNDQDPSIFVGFSPFNNPFSALLAMIRARPRGVIFVESARYLHIAFFARLFGAKTLVANVNISEKRKQEQQSKPTGSFRYRLIGAVTVQSERQLDRLIEIGVPSQIISVTGPAIYEKVTETEFERYVEKWNGLLNISNGSTPVVVAGSTHPEEEPTILKAFSDFKRRFPTALLVIAPRYFGLSCGSERGVGGAGVPYVLRSRLSDGIPDSGVIVLDTQGELREVYSVAAVAFVGGSLAPEIGGHSPIEPLLWGTPVTMGPNYAQQEPAVSACLSAGVLFVCSDADSLNRAWTQAAEGNGRRAEFARKAAEMLDRHRNVFDKWLEALFGFQADSN